MGLCSLIYDNVPLSWDMCDDKYPLTYSQMDTVKGADVTLRFDVQDIVREWRITDMICEAMDLLDELEQMKRYGTVSKAASTV